jgi:hypothetical protein
MAPTVLTGALGVEDTLSSKAVLDVSPGLRELYKDISPLFMIFNELPKGRVAFNEKVSWIRKDLVASWDTLTTAVAQGAAGATVTLIPTGDGNTVDGNFNVGDTVEVPAIVESSTVTSIGRVTAVSSDTSITVDPIGWVSDSIAGTEMKFGATKIGDKIHVIADASEEYSQKPAMRVSLDTTDWNYIQFLRVPFIVGNINMDEKKYTGPERAERRDETYKAIRIQSEELFMHGKRYYVDGTNGRQFFMQGIKRFIVDGAGSNVLVNWSGGLSEGDFDEFLVKGPGMYGGTRKLAFFSNDLFLKINEFAKTKERIQGTINFLGLEFTKYIAPDNVTYYMRRHHLLKEGYAGAGLIVDPTAVRIRPYGTQGQMRLLTNIQENDRAGIADEWQVIFSLEVDRIEPHAWIEA